MLKFKVYAALVLVQIIFGIHYFVNKLILDLMSPRAWAALRVLGAAAVLMLYNLVYLRRHPKRLVDLGRLALFAFFGVVLNQILFIEGLSRTTPSHSAIVNSLIPVLTLLIALLLRRERTTPLRVLSIVVSFSSVLFLLRIESFRIENELVVGDLLTLANASSFSLFLVISRDYLRHNHPMAATSYLMLIGSLGVLLLGAEPLGQVSFEELPGRFWLWASYVILGGTALAYFLNFYALQHVDSSMVALFVYLQAPIATLLSVAYLHERPTARFFVCAAGVFLGVFMAVWARKPPHRERARSSRV